MNISEKSFIEAAEKINCSVAMIKAVAEVESSGGGFLPTGEVKILFEPHIFYKELLSKKIKPILSDICYPKWGQEPYGKMSEQHNRLQRAVKIDRESALKSASWGAFQILGTNYKLCGCSSIQEFINIISKDEDSQLELFVNYIINVGLSDEMNREDCAEFARIYNGPSYKKNKYDQKIQTALKKLKK